MKKGELLFILCLLIPLVPMAIAKQWWLFSVFLTFYGCFGFMEWRSVASSGRSISQKFWDFSQGNKLMAYIILGTMAIMWVALLFHLGVKL